MAFALPSAGEDVLVTFTFDGLNKSVQRQYRVKWNTDLATTLADALALGGLIQPLTDAGVAEGVITIPIVDAAAVAPVANQPVFDNAVLSLQLDTSGDGKNPYGTLTIPAPSNTIMAGTVGPSSNIVNMSNADVEAFIDAFEPTGTATLSDHQTVLAAGVHSGKRIAKKGKYETP